MHFFSFWLLIWFALSAALLYFMCWTLYILFRQKRAWRTYALSKKLRYNPHEMLGSPDISGSLNGCTVSIFTSEHGAPDDRGSRKLTAAEVQLPMNMPFDVCLASGGMIEIARSVKMDELRPANADWSETWYAGSTNSLAFEAYMTPERLNPLIALMKTKNAWVIMVLRNRTMLLRVDTPDPLDTAEKLEKLMRRMTEAAQLLELKTGEEKKLKAITPKKPPRAKTIQAKVEEDTGLSLEEEEAPKPEAPEENPPG